MEDGIEEINTIKVIYCKGFKKLLNIKNCNTKCEHFKKRHIDPVMQGDVQIEEVDRVLCGYPEWLKVMQVCETVE